MNFSVTRAFSVLIFTTEGEKRVKFSLQGEVTVYMIAAYGNGRLYWPLVESKLYTSQYSFNGLFQSSGKWSVDYLKKKKSRGGCSLSQNHEMGLHLILSNDKRKIPHIQEQFLTLLCWKFREQENKIIQ